MVSIREPADAAKQEQEHMNKTQLQTTVAPLIGIAAGYLAGSGALGLSAGDWGTVLTGLVGVGAILWPAFVTRMQSLKDTVGKSGAIVVTAPASAEALPNNPNVVTPAQAAPVLATAK
jgi:hypothetical protein